MCLDHISKPYKIPMFGDRIFEFASHFYKTLFLKYRTSLYFLYVHPRSVFTKKKQHTHLENLCPTSETSLPRI